MSVSCDASEAEQDRFLKGIAPLERATEEDLCFVAQSAYLPLLEKTHAGAVLIRDGWQAHVPEKTVGIIVEDPYAAYALIARHWYGRRRPESGIDPTARIHPEAEVARDVTIGAHVVIEAGVRIAEDCWIEDGCIIQRDTVLEAAVHLEPGVVIYPRCSIGAQTRIKAGAVIGSEGFGFAPFKGRWIPIPQLGGVRIGRRCSIGANTTIDRGALEDTVIEDDVIIDNLVHIAHNVQVGQGTAMAAQVGVAGSARIGRYCQFGGQAGMPGHLTLADGVTMMARGAPGGDIDTPGAYAGFPAIPHGEWKKAKIHQRRLPQLAREIRGLKKQVDALRQQLQDTQ